MNISVIELTRRLQNALDKNYNVSMKNDLRKKNFFSFALDFIFQCWRQKKNGNENWNEKKKLLPSTQLGLRLSWRRAHTNSRARLSSVWPRIQFAISLCWLNVERTAKAQKFEKKFPFVSFLSLSLGVCRCVEAKSFFLSFGCTWTVEWCDAKDAHRDLIWLFESVVWGGRTRLCARSLEKWD